MLRRSWILICAFIMFANLSSKEYLYEDLQSELKNLKADESKVAIIKDLFWQKENGMFSLDSGKMYFMQPINNRISCAIFIGKGSFAFTPPTKVEKIQLERLMKTQFFNTEVEAMVMFFTDSTYEFIKNNFAITTGEIPYKVGDLYERAKKYLIYVNNDEVNYLIARGLLSNESTNLFYSLSWVNLGRIMEHPYIWVCDPLEDEEIKFSKGNWHSGSGFYTDLINQFRSVDNNINPNIIKNNDFIVIDKYEIKIETDRDHNFNCSTIVKFANFKKNVEWLNFDLAAKMTIDSILDENGKSLYFHRGKENNNFWIKFNEPLKDSTNYRLYFYYKSKFIHYSEWYPEYNYKQNTFFDISFKMPKSHKLISIGEQVSYKEDSEYLYSRWITNKKLNYASYLYKDYYSIVIDSDSLSPKLNIYYLAGSDIKSFINDLKQVINFFNNTYGTNIIDELTIAESGDYFSSIAPGIIELSKYGLNSSGCAREFSKFWWGISVKANSYRDRWLTTALPVYSGLMYTGNYLNDTEALYKYLKRSNELLFNLRKNFLFNEVKAGAITLGYRNNTELTKGDFEDIVYNKGVWVLHMLRNLFIDFDTMDDKLFFAMLKEFFETHKDSYATTQDFVNIVSKYAGADMRWFFEQWVESNEMPTYTFGYKKEKTPEGKYKVTARIKQTGVNEKFMMSVPVKVDYGESYRVLRLNVTKPFIEFEFPLFDEEPKKFQLNAYESVLCEVEYEDFEDIEP